MVESQEPNLIVEEVEQEIESSRIEHCDIDGSLELNIGGQKKFTNIGGQVIQEENEEKLEETVQMANNDNKSIEIKLEYDEDESEGEGDDVVLFIEYKYCTICHIEQPLRCKHCKTCDHCVATHDHHCPWIGNCVGERNKIYFFWFI